MLCAWLAALLTDRVSPAALDQSQLDLVVCIFHGETSCQSWFGSTDYVELLPVTAVLALVANSAVEKIVKQLAHLQGILLTEG